MDEDEENAQIEWPEGSSDENEHLLQWLGYVRGGVLRDAAGLTDEQGHWTPDGKLISLVGILNHLTHMEWRWIDGGFRGAEVSYEPESEFHPEGLTLAEALAAYRARAASTDAFVRATSLDTVSPESSWGRGHDLRFVVLHVLEETARHAGHADATREMLDGSTGL
ncbi:MAG TPA: DUF664 domain-containing protein [Acidimicrobiales bacterium]